MRPRRIESVGCSNSARLTAAAAALQFSLRESRITSTIVGISEPERVEQTLRLAEWSIPRLLFDGQVGLDITVRGLNALVAQPQGNDCDVYP